MNNDGAGHGHEHVRIETQLIIIWWLFDWHLCSC